MCKFIRAFVEVAPSAYASLKAKVEQLVGGEASMPFFCGGGFAVDRWVRARVQR